MGGKKGEIVFLKGSDQRGHKELRGKNGKGIEAGGASGMSRIQGTSKEKSENNGVPPAIQ